MRIVLLLTALATVCQAQNDCYRGACYPPNRDLLLGRGHMLHASSTCGLTGSEVFCTPYQLRKMKCCPCDSRNPNGPLAHTTQELLSTSSPDRWWQSKKGLSPVSLQFDLDNLYQLDNLVLDFKGPRPSTLVLERTLDNGRTWQPAVYLATDCERAFPGVPTTAPASIEQTYCHTLPPTGSNPYKDHTIQFSPLRQYAHVPAPNSRKIESLSGLNGLRVRLLELGEVPSLPGRSLSKFYALKEMRVMGSCMCHGHANKCLPEAYSNPESNSIQVNPQCECQHNTAGVNCERCADLYNDLPWRPAEEEHTHTCQRCECNNHAQSCSFDPAVYEASGRRSGGVCQGCLHHTTGPKCDQCAPGYSPNPRSRMDRPDACISCVCSAEGSVNGGQCDDDTGLCRCKANVEGPRCDRCKTGFHGLSASNPLGCSKCSCSSDGSASQVCDPVTGQCPCLPQFHGLTCALCSRGYWKPPQSARCQACGCDPTKAYSDSCDQTTGQCECRPGFGGRTCNECPDKTYGNPLTGCKPCRCDAEGSLPEACDKRTGVCLCRPGVSGARCDSCSRGHCDLFPACDTCPSCFFTLDDQRRSIVDAVDRLSSRVPTGPGGPDLGKLQPRIRALEKSLTLIRSSITLPPQSSRDIDDVLTKLTVLRGQVDKIDNDLSPLEKTPGLEKELDDLEKLYNSILLEYKDKKKETDSSVSPGSTKDFNAIKTAYEKSTDAEKQVDDTKGPVDESADNRDKTKDLINKQQPANTKDLDKLNQDMATGPNLTPVAKQVCGSVRTKPCTPQQCDGSDLCPPEGTPPCAKGSPCVGALPLGKRADADATETTDQLKKLTDKITDTDKKLKEAQDKTNQVRQSADKLNKKITKTSDDMKDDLEKTRDVVKELKDFLTDPGADLKHTQVVSDWILNAKLPFPLDDLLKKIEDLDKLGKNLPDSTKVLKDAQPLLDKAKKLLQEAVDARDKAVDVKGDVDGLVEGFKAAEDTIADTDAKLQDTLDLIDNLEEDLGKVEQQLVPAEKTLRDTTGLVDKMKPKLDELDELLKNAKKDAQDANVNADEAKKDADDGNNDLTELEKQLKVLKEGAPKPPVGGDSGPMGDRVTKLRDDVGALTNTTDDMVNSLKDKADTLRTLHDTVVNKSKDLLLKEDILKKLLAELQSEAKRHREC